MSSDLSNDGQIHVSPNCETDQHLCFRYTDSTSLLLSKSKIFSLESYSVPVQLRLCRTYSKVTLLSHDAAHIITGIEFAGFDK